MGLEEEKSEMQLNNDESQQTLTICLHVFSDLTNVSPVVFLYLLKECYVHGSCKATKKFRALQQQVHQVLWNSPQPGPSTFVIQCLHVLPIFGLYCEGFSHLLVSALRRFLKLAPPSEDTTQAKVLAAQLFIEIVEGSISHDERIALKILEVFDVKMTDMEEAMCRFKAENSNGFDTAKTFVEQYILRYVESDSYMTAVSLLEQFSIRQSGQSFLLKMMENKQSRAAEKWATFMGKPMISILVQEYFNRNMLKNAYDTIKKNNLKEEFPDVYHKCQESKLKKLAEKGLWDLAEMKTGGDRQLIEYLVYLAMEARYSEKVDELVARYSLEGFLKGNELEASVPHDRYLQFNELVVGDIVWVDEVDALYAATCCIEGCKVVGLDSEWKPNYVKGSKPNKVSILQIASDKMVFIFDLIKLFEDAPSILDNCLTRILQSPRVLKLGYNFQCDIRQLAQSYGELKCFKQYEMLLDIQNLFKEVRGGLSGLAKELLGAGLNKTRRNSNWEERPLSRNQLEYAALDAVVLVHMFNHIRNHPNPATLSEGNEKIEWKSCIVSQTDKPKKKKQSPKYKKKASGVIN
ncbi:Polynucleotidyl transferase ribonuclease H-like superfamily protein [Euphorbia peplus]|nr:Polynucleotidyl transferase ribonuclease H-like superfamily protein [Euphorbia peplus]